jgi:hypothetical protein
LRQPCAAPLIRTNGAHQPKTSEKEEERVVKKKKEWSFHETSFLWFLLIHSTTRGIKKKKIETAYHRNNTAKPPAQFSSPSFDFFV